MAKKKPTKKSFSKSKNPKRDVPFEESLEKLRESVSQLENGNLSLSDSLATYEEGVASLKQCYEALNSAQRKIEKLVNLDENGNLTTEPFDDSASLNKAEEDEDFEDDDVEDEEFEEEGALEDGESLF